MNDKKDEQYRGTIITEWQFYDIEGNGKQRRGDCDSIEPKEPVDQLNMGVPYICGTKSDMMFIEYNSLT